MFASSPALNALENSVYDVSILVCKKVDKELYQLSNNETFDFFEKKRRQISSNGSPFASPINVPTNISGGALGIWAGFSPYYDTLYCIE